ncbi:MAG TPA: DUF72 domain-containing protein [Chitinivibrionales bacterium]|jgi:uncharacterized protein YecE (DUF72 family)|nr:DUF72 domain-containing protein [Chitinivibrionales bacterium]
MKILTGTSGYGYKEWKGNFYPEKISADKMLGFYSSRLSTVEINNTFYHMPAANVILSWAEQAPAGFTFVIKAPQIITHVKRLKDVKEETRYFFKTISGLGRKLGPVLFQFPGSFREDLSVLEDFLSLIPPKTPCAFLFRNKSWFSEGTYTLLRREKFCLGLEDTDENPIEEIVNTVPWGYLRLRRSDYTETELSQWAKKVLAQEWKKAFVFFKHEDDEAARGPQLATSFKEIVSHS